MTQRKITVVGAGNVGGSIAQRLAEKDGYEIVLVDIVDGLPQGKALDLAQAGAVCGEDSRITGTGCYDATADSEAVVITSGIARKPGMSRSELLATNIQIVQSVVREASTRSPSAILVIVANPLDVMTYAAWRGERLSGAARGGYGRHSGFCPVPPVYCAGVERAGA